MSIYEILCEFTEYGITYEDLSDRETYTAIQDEFELSDADMEEVWDLIQSGKVSLTTLYIPEGVTVIESGRYANNRNFDAVVFPSTLRRVESNAFVNCWNMHTATLNDRLEYIGDSAFFHTGLNAVTLPSSVKYVGDSAFSNCDALTDFVCLGRNTVLSDYAVAYCTELDNIDIKSSYVSKKCFVGSVVGGRQSNVDVAEFESEIFDWLRSNMQIDNDYHCLRGNILLSGEILHNPNNCVHNVVENDICEYLNNKFDADCQPNQGIYGELILDILGCVRLNGQHEYFVVIPNNITDAQLDTLENWLDYVFEYSDYKKQIQVTTVSGHQASFDPYKFTGYDIVKYIKNKLV